MTKAIKYHHYPVRSQGSELAYIIHVADAVAMMTGMGLGVDGMLYQMDETAMGFLDLTQNDVNSLIGEVTEAVQKISDQMS